MDSNIELHEMDAMIRRIRSAAERLNRLGENFPSLTKNSFDVLLTSAKTLEVNINALVQVRHAGEAKIA